MTIEEITKQYQAVAEEFKRMGAIGGCIADQSVHIYGDDNWSAIPGEEKSKHIFYSDGSSAEELRKKYNGVTFYILINKKAAPTEEADTEKNHYHYCTRNRCCLQWQGRMLRKMCSYRRLHLLRKMRKPAGLPH